MAGMTDVKVKRSTAILALVVVGVPWALSIPWLLYLSLQREIPWTVPLICTPIYLLLLYGLRSFWIAAFQQTSER